MAADYPSGLTSKALMGQAQDNISSTINQTGGLTAVATTVTLASATAFPTSGYIQADTETMKYTGKSSNDLTGLTRGLFGTTAAAHANGTTVELTNSAGYIDELQEEVIALQAKLGVDSSAVTTTLDFLAKSATARAHRGTSAQSITNTTWTKIQLNAESWDTGGNFDSTTNYRFTAPVTGKYQVSACLSWAASGTGTVNIAIYVNGSVTSYAVFPNNASNALIIPLGDTLNLAATDYVELYGYQNSGGALNVNTDISGSYMSISLIKL